MRQTKSYEILAKELQRHAAAGSDSEMARGSVGYRGLSARFHVSHLLFAGGNDYQTSHDQDELYIIVKGSGVLEIEGQPIEFQAGDALFVPAGKRHRLVRFEKGIEMWAVFYGPAGGERSA